MKTAALLLALSFAVPARAEDARPSRAAIGVMREGVRAYMEARFDDAVSLLTESLSMHPGWKTAAGFRAICLWTTGDIEGARADAKLSIRLRPNSSESYTARGFAHFVLRDFAKASDDFIAAARRGRNYGPAYFGMGSVLSSQEKLRDALTNLDIAAKLEPNSAAIRIVRGTVYEKTKELKNAAADYGKVVELAPHFHWARFYRGRTYRELKDYPKAIADLSAFLKHNPDYEKALYFRSNAYFLSGDYKSALDDLSRLIRVNPKHGLAYANRGMARSALGDSTGALEDLEKAKGLLPDKASKIQAQIDAMGTAPAGEEEETVGEESVTGTPGKGLTPPPDPEDIPVEPLPEELPEDKPRFTAPAKEASPPAHIPGEKEPNPDDDEEGGDFMFIR